MEKLEEYDKNGNMTYSESDDGSWTRWEYNEKGNLIRIRFENNDGKWKCKKNGRQTRRNKLK